MRAGEYKVRLDAFEGPLDLLLHLVRSNEVDLYDLPIANITDQYLEYVNLFEELNLSVAGEYLVMAASLMYMKSRLLLPQDETDPDEDDPVEDLVRQLEEYQRYREVSEALRDRALLDRDVFRRAPTPPEDAAGEAGELRFAKVELADLFESLRRVLERAAARRPHTVADEDYPVADAVRDMVNCLRGKGPTEFRDLFEGAVTRGRIISTFIGLLELMRLAVLDAEQSERGGPIYIRLVSDDIDETLEELAGMYGAGSAAGSVAGDGEPDDTKEETEN